MSGMEGFIVIPEEGERNVERPGENKRGLEIIHLRLLLE